jgi:hypothetical protein
VALLRFLRKLLLCAGMLLRPAHLRAYHRQVLIEYAKSDTKQLSQHVPVLQLLGEKTYSKHHPQHVQVLHLLGEMAPETAEPSRFVRFMYNRVILENATVRAAAVSSLAAIGARCPSLRDRIVIILRRSLADSDDEVHPHPHRDAVIMPCVLVPLSSITRHAVCKDLCLLWFMKAFPGAVVHVIIT